MSGTMYPEAAPGGVQPGGVQAAAGRRAERAPRRASIFDARSLLGLGYVAVAAALAAVAAWPVYASPRMLVVALVGLAAGLGVAIVARLLPQRGLLGGFLTVLIAIGVYAVIVVPVAIPSALGSPSRLLAGVRDGFVGIVVGWKQLLTLSLPLGEYQAVLVPFLLVVFVGSLVGGLLVLPDRSSSPLAVAAGFGMTAFGIVFGSSQLSSSIELGPIVIPAPRELLVGIGGLVAAIGWLLLRSRSLRRQALQRATAGTVQRSGLSGWVAVRRRALAGGLIALALVAGAAVAPAAAQFADRTALRDRVEPELAVRQTPSPLSGYRAAFTAANIDVPWFSITGDQVGTERVRIATLDHYDGEMFQVAADPDDPETRFTRLPRAAERHSGDAALEFTVEDGYTGLWVPAPAGLVAAPDFAGPRATALEDGYHRSADGSTSISIAPLPGNEQLAAPERGVQSGDHYSLVTEPDVVRGIDELGSPSGQPRLSAETYPALADWVELQAQPRSAEGFAELVERLRARGYLSHAASEGEDSAAWIERLSDGYVFLPSYSGHSVARIETLFTQLADQQRLAGDEASDAALVAGVGDDEQFAAATALLARYLGYESRVVLGFRLGGAEAVDGVPNCDTSCPGGSLAAWVEVRSQNGDWVTVDVTPQHEVAPSLIQEGEQLPEHPTTPDTPDTDTLDPPPAQSDTSDAAAAPPTPPGADLSWLFTTLRWVALGFIGLLSLLLPFLVLLIVKAVRRRRRRHAADAEVRVVGAWDELVDTYSDHRLLNGEAGSRADTAHLVGRPAAAELAELVDRAVFAGDPPTAEDASAAWALVDAERTALRREAKGRRRLAVMLSFASFLRTIRPARVLTEEPTR